MEILPSNNVYNSLISSSGWRNSWAYCISCDVA